VKKKRVKMEVREKNPVLTLIQPLNLSRLLCDANLYKTVVFSIQSQLSNLSCSLFSESFPVDLTTGKTYMVFTSDNTHIPSFKTMNIPIYLSRYTYML